MEKEFTHPLAKQDQYKLIRLFIEHNRAFAHNAFSEALTIMSLLTTDVVVIKADCSFNQFSDNPYALFYCNQAGRELLRDVFEKMNRKLPLSDRFRNQLFEGTCHHDFVEANGGVNNMTVKYIGWSFNYLSVSKKECYRIINLFCETLLDVMGVNR